MENEALTMRRLCADDLFTMMRILSKIGVNDLRSVMPTKTAIQRVREGSESAESLGVTVALMIADKLLVKRLHAVLETLDPEDQEMIHAVFFDGLSMREYAKRLGVYPRAVVYRMERLLKALRKML